jgi:hypothetical protein
MELSIKWNDKRLLWPTRCTNGTTLEKFSIDKIYWSELWLPDLTIDDITKIEPVTQLGPSEFLTVSQVFFKVNISKYYVLNVDSRFFIFKVILANAYCLVKDTRTVIELPGMTMKPEIRI